MYVYARVLFLSLSLFAGHAGFFGPEMITHGSYYGDKVDIWSVGCILLELVLGHERFCDMWMTAYDYEVRHAVESDIIIILFLCFEMFDVVVAHA